MASVMTRARRDDLDVVGVGPEQLVAVRRVLQAHVRGYRAADDGGSDDGGTTDSAPADDGSDSAPADDAGGRTRAAGARER